MNNGTKAILTFLLNKRYIGGKHFPEKKLFISRTEWHLSLNPHKVQEIYEMIV